MPLSMTIIKIIGIAMDLKVNSKMIITAKIEMKFTILWNYEIYFEPKNSECP